MAGIILYNNKSGPKSQAICSAKGPIIHFEILSAFAKGYAEAHCFADEASDRARCHRRRELIDVLADNLAEVPTDVGT
jgi:hypothetical protein